MILKGVPSTRAVLNHHELVRELEQSAPQLSRAMHQHQIGFSRKLPVALRKTFRTRQSSNAAISEDVVIHTKPSIRFHPSRQIRGATHGLADTGSAGRAHQAEQPR